MNTLEWLSVAAAALLIGGVAGAWFMERALRKRVLAERRRELAALERKHSESISQFRAAHLRVQAELDQTRNSFRRQLLAAADEPRAELSRVSQRLQMAYGEIDRLRRQLDGASSTMRPELTDGFAVTLPMAGTR